MLATQNPIELEGTYPLPEAQLDRFTFKIDVYGVSSDTLQQIISKRQHGRPPELSEVISHEELERLFDLVDMVHLPEAVANYIARLVNATHPDSPEAPAEVSQFVRYGASPRAAIALAGTSRAAALLSNKPNVGFDEVRRVAPSVLGHRLVLDYAARLEGWTPRRMVERLVEAVPEVGRRGSPGRDRLRQNPPRSQAPLGNARIKAPLCETEYGRRALKSPTETQCRALRECVPQRSWGARGVQSLGTRAHGCLFIAALLAVLIPTQQAGAAGDEHLFRGDDLVVTVSTKWAGCSNGGYYPIRLLVQNKGVDCTVTCSFAGEQEGVAAAQRTIAVAQNATVKFTLPVPCVGAGTYGELKIFRDGRLVKGMDPTVSLPDAQSGGTARPSFLVISPTDVDFDPLESAVTSTLPEATGSGGGYGGYSGYYGVATENHERIDATLLPEEWIAYSGLDFVAVPLATLAKFTTSERTALLSWVHTGGSLIVYEVKDEAAQSQQLTDLLKLNEHAAVSDEWRQADAFDEKLHSNRLDMDNYGNVVTRSRGGSKTAA